MRSSVSLFATIAACALATHTHAERVGDCSTAVASFSLIAHGAPSEQTPAPFEKKKDAILSIYRATTEGLSLAELQGLTRQPFDFKDFKDATNLARAHEKFIQLKKTLPSFSVEERIDLMNAIQALLTEKILNAQTSQKSWSEKRGAEKDLKLVQILKIDSGSVESIAFLPDGRLLASSRDDRGVRVWDITKCDRAPTIAWSERLIGVTSVAISPNGESLASGNSNGTIRLWDVRNLLGTSTPITLDGHERLVHSLAFSPDGKMLASGHSDGTILLWQLTIDKPTSIALKRDASGNGIASIAWSSDGKLLAWVDYSNTLVIANLITGEHDLIILKDTPNPASSIAFSPDSKHIALGAVDNTIRILNSKDRSGAPVILEGHRDWVGLVAFSPDGRTLASGSADRTIRLWKWSEILNLGRDRLEEDAP